MEEKAIIVNEKYEIIIDGIFDAFSLYHEHVVGSKIGKVSDLDVILKKAREPIIIIEKGRRTDMFRDKHVLFEEFDCMHSYLQEKAIVICDVMCIHLVAFYRDINRVSRYVKEHSTVILEKNQTLLKWMHASQPSYYCPRDECKKYHAPGDDLYKPHRFLRMNDIGGVDLIGMASKHPSFRVNVNAEHGCALWQSCNHGETCPSNNQATCPDAKKLHDAYDAFEQWIAAKIGGRPISFSKVEIIGFFFEYIKKLKKMNHDTTFMELHKQNVIDRACTAIFFHSDAKKASK